MKTPPLWTISQARRWVGHHHKEAFRRGFCLLIGGGVAYRGWSNNDMDVLAYPSTAASDFKNLIGMFDSSPSPKLEWIDVALIHSFTCALTGKPVEMIYQSIPVPGLPLCTK